MGWYRPRRAGSTMELLPYSNSLPGAIGMGGGVGFSDCISNIIGVEAHWAVWDFTWHKEANAPLLRVDLPPPPNLHWLQCRPCGTSAGWN